jgi:hypothetical protein
MEKLSNPRRSLFFFSSFLESPLRLTDVKPIIELVKALREREKSIEDDFMIYMLHSQ